MVEICFYIINQIINKMFKNILFYTNGSNVQVLCINKSIFQNYTKIGNPMLTDYLISASNLNRNFRMI